MRAAFYTLGCKVNQYETAALQRQFQLDGFQVVDWEEAAEVYIINSCTVTASGDKKSRQMLRRVKRQNPQAVAVLCGCFPQAFPDEAREILEADIIAGTKERSALLSTVRAYLEGAGKERMLNVVPHHKGEAFEHLLSAGQSERTRAFVKIQDGCQRYCAYCIIPKARGPVRSKPLADIRAELEGLAGLGYREAVLVGINLSSYGVDLGLQLLDAVREACGVAGIARVRLGSLEPELLGPEDIRALAELPGLCPQFHLSLQSGCDATLRRMRRHYDTAEYRRIVDNLREAFPGCAITTDVMVGFPGETEEEFARSQAFVREIGFARSHVFAYSPRKGTVAAAITEQVPEREKANRAKAMAAAGQDCMLAYWREQRGKTAQVLVEQRQADGSWTGYTETYIPVRLTSQENLEGAICTVRLGEVAGDCVQGTVV